ncbi:MAG: alanine--glyoxylate aminotransferase family protein [Epsilonproteobacteria bacterium]|nr:alanine--glyoxylate aminotransferase family protein [Campylobacterota bacterium]
MSSVIKQRLFTPGPTPVPHYVREALAEPAIHHRTEQFKELLIDTRKKLSKMADSSSETVVITSSGTGAMEASVSNFFSTGERVVVIRAGKFGERWGDICKVFGLDITYYDIEYGNSADPNEIERIVKKENPAALFIQATETSTGTFHPIAEIGEIINRVCPSCLYIVDGISTMGAVEIKTDLWNIDMLIWGSQKGLMIPPGLSFITVNDKALKKARFSNLPHFYFNIVDELKKQKNGSTLYTPATALIVALKSSLDKIFEEGLDNLYKRHKLLSKATRAALIEMGFSIFPKDPSDTLTVITKRNTDFEKIRSDLLSKFGILTAGGQGDLKGSIIRIAHMGYFDIVDMIGFLGIFKLVCSNYFKIETDPVEKFLEIYKA